MTLKRKTGLNVNHSPDETTLAHALKYRHDNKWDYKKFMNNELNEVPEEVLRERARGGAPSINTMKYGARSVMNNFGKLGDKAMKLRYARALAAYDKRINDVNYLSRDATDVTNNLKQWALGRKVRTLPDFTIKKAMKSRYNGWYDNYVAPWKQKYNDDQALRAGKHENLSSSSKEKILEGKADLMDGAVGAGYGLAGMAAVLGIPLIALIAKMRRAPTQQQQQYQLPQQTAPRLNAVFSPSNYGGGFA
jgi:hypothetical protein